MDVLDPIAWSLLLTLAGCGLLVLEVFLPSGGVLSVLSLAAFVSGILIAFYNGGATTGFTFVVLVLIAGPVTLGLAFYILPSTSIGKALLGEVPTEAEVAPDDPRRELVGKFGTARTKMLPSGSVEIDDQMVDAIARGEAIEPGQRVQVVEVRANRVVVRLARDQSMGTSDNEGDLLSRGIEELGIEGLEDPLS